MSRAVQPWTQRGMRQAGALALAMVALAGGCFRGPVLLRPEEQVVVDRRYVEYPAGFLLKPVIRGLTAPTAIAFDADGAMLIAEGGLGEGGMGWREPRIFGFRPDGTRFDIYPRPGRLPLGPVRAGFRIHGPIGGMAADGAKVFVTHRDAEGHGVVTAFSYDGTRATVVAELPAQGDHALTDIAVHPSGRLYFGIGTATNSGVVGLDNWAAGWVQFKPKVCDVPAVDLKLRGYRFTTRNPRAGFFGGDDVAVTGPFQPFGTSTRQRIKVSDRPNGAVFSVSPGGGDLRVEAHGIHHPRGLAFNEFGRLYMTNSGMELRGTRPVKDDPDALLRVVAGTWYGWPDYSADLQPLTEARFQPPHHLTIRTGYSDVAFLLDHEASGLIRPDRETLVQGVFPSLSGAAKLDFIPAAGPFKEYRGNAIVALSGDRAPFATSGTRLVGPIGYKVVRVDVDSRQVRDFIRNTRGIPSTLLEPKERHQDMLERPFDIKLGPDGSLYVVDLGVLEMRDGQEHIRQGTGKILKLTPAPHPTTR